MKKQILSYLILGSMLSFSNIVSAATVDEAFHYTDQKVDGVVYYVDQKADGLVNYTNQKTDELHQDIKRNEKRIADNFDLIQNNIDKINDNERKLKDHTDVLQKHEDILNGHSQELEKHNKLIVNHDNQITRLTKENLRQDADLLRHEDQIQNHDIQLKNQTERMNNQEKRIDNQDKRLDYLDNRVDNHDARIENHSERIESHERRIEYNKTLATEALKEAKKHTSISAGNNVTVTTSTNAAGGTDYKVSVDKVKFGNVSLDNKGLNNGGNKITNVADGEVSATSKDAVNGSQLYNVINNTNNRYNSLNNRVNNLDQRVNKVGAATAALAALHPQDFNPNDKFSAAIGFGNYKGSNSVAIGAFYRPNENTLLSIGTTMGSEKMFNAGVSLKFGHNDKMNSDTKVAVAKEVQDLARKYEDLSQKYDNLIKLLDKKEVSEFKSDLSSVEGNQQYKIIRVDNSDTEKGRIERIKAKRK